MMECAAQLENLLNWSTVPHTSLGFLQHSKLKKETFGDSAGDGREGNTGTCSHGEESSNGRKHAGGHTKL
jgi:hypothetical protein